MNRTNVLALVLAGGAGSRMEVLTEERAKPALPFAGVYRLIDFPMSNLRHSGIEDVWVVAQYETQSINDILAGGRPWDMDRTHGGFRLITPQQEKDNDDAWHQGNADAIYRLRELIREYDPDVLLVLSADHVYQLDYRDPLEAHLASGADCTMVTTRVPIDQASNHAVVTLDGDRVATFAYKPDEPESEIVATEIFFYNPGPLLETLETLVRENGNGSDTGLEDFGNHLLPRLLEQGDLRAWMLDGYWKDVGRPETWFQAHMDLINPEMDLALDDPEWPIFTLGHQRMPAVIGEHATVTRSLISPGARVDGRVECSVLGPGVVVEPGADIRHAVILHDTVIHANATIQWSIIDRNCEIGQGATIGESPSGDLPTTEELVLIGLGNTIHGRRVIKAGERVSPASEGTQIT